MFRRIYYDYQRLCLILPTATEKAAPLSETEFGRNLIDMLIVAEDHRNRYHIGVDVIAIARALYRRIKLSANEGASTIEQQLVRVVTGDYRHTVSRKIKEILLAIYIRRRFNRRVLAMTYLEMAYYGTLYQSLDSILSKYGLTKTDAIDIRTCAEIVARLKYPEPRKASDARVRQIEARTSHILKLYLQRKNQREL